MKAGKRYKTVELIIDEAAWTPPPQRENLYRPEIKIDQAEKQPVRHEVGVKVFFRENELREQVKAAGGRWTKSDKLWQLPYETAISLGLKHRIAKQ